MRRVIENCFLYNYNCMCCNQVSDASASASWRHERLTHADFLARQMECGRVISPLFEAPYVTKDVIRRDWLHNCDHGVGQDFAGNVLKTLSQKMMAPTHKQRVQLLWERIQRWYEQNHVMDKMPILTEKGIEMDKKGPCLKASAACVRALYPFLVEASNELLSSADPKEKAIQIACFELNKCKECLSQNADCLWSDILEDSAKRFALQLDALSQIAEKKDYKVRPKMHHFLEMCADGQKPSLSWTYRDEDYGGTIAKLSRRRGGKKSATSWSFQTLTLFQIHNPVPRLL